MDATFLFGCGAVAAGFKLVCVGLSALGLL